MLGKRKTTEDVKLEEVTDNLLDAMVACSALEPEYPTLLNHLERLTALRSDKKRKPVSLDNAVLVAGNLLGILIIVAYEQKHVMTSKGLNFVLKSK